MPETTDKLRPITLADLQCANYGDRIIYTGKHNSQGCFPRVKVNGMPKLWKRKPYSVRVPYKYGLYEFGYLTEDDIRTQLWYTDKPPLDNSLMPLEYPKLIEA
jgi:hypothetical protein